MCFERCVLAVTTLKRYRMSPFAVQINKHLRSRQISHTLSVLQSLRHTCIQFSIHPIFLASYVFYIFYKIKEKKVQLACHSLTSSLFDKIKLQRIMISLLFI